MVRSTYRKALIGSFREVTPESLSIESKGCALLAHFLKLADESSSASYSKVIIKLAV